MHDPRLTELFERYRREGDLSALAKLFDAISPEMMRVARHVAGRGVDPEDVLQSTFLASIERSETFDATRPIVPWLMGILINQARLMNRRRVTRHALFLAQAYGLQLGAVEQFTVVFVALVTSIGVAGIPAASLVAITIILSAIGLPVEAVGLILVTDRVLDMVRTSINVFSDSCGAVIIARSEGETGVLADPPGPGGHGVPAGRAS
jgi:hypothetical protein